MEIEPDSNVCLIVIGMAGTGKTTLVHQLTQKSSKVFCINLDPAVKNIPYEPFIDIRQSHDYKKVMKEYKLGPNGAIMTALNLYTAQPQKIIDDMLSKTKEKPGDKIFVIDIPGQIQVFTWSASSLILTEAIATLMPVKICYITDSFRCQNPNNFLSNLLFAQSIQCRFKKFQFLILLNKSDCSDCDRLLSWFNDYQQFLKALQEDSTYLASLSRSVVLNLCDFYDKIKIAKISAKTGFGLGELHKFIGFTL